MAMAITSDSKLELKLLIDKKLKKVLFAEVGKNVVDFLLRLLSLPFGSVIKIIAEESTFSPLCNTYRSWEQLDHSFLSSTRMTANSLIPVFSPTSSSNFALLLSSSSRATTKETIYVCNCKTKYTDVDQTICKQCGNTYMDKELSYSYNGPSVTKEAIERNGYVKDGITYAVLDDLSVVPMTPLAIIEIFIKMGYDDLSLLEEKTVTMHVQQGFELLKTLLRSKNVLTDMFLAKKNEGHEEEAELALSF